MHILHFNIYIYEVNRIWADVNVVDPKMLKFTFFQFKFILLSINYSNAIILNLIILNGGKIYINSGICEWKRLKAQQ